MKGLKALCVGLLLSVASQAQHLHCGTDYMVEQSLRQNPQKKAQYYLMQQAAKSSVEKPKNTTSGNRLIIPVVVHIIHNFGVENVSDNQVEGAIRVLNEDFQRKSPDTGQISAFFKPLLADVDVEFRLAKRDPNGNCTKGITRTVSALTAIADDNVKDLISWDTEKYFNIWVVRSISFGAGGYAYYPGTAPTQQDEGVVVLYTQFGPQNSNFAERTLTHEAGHYFNLAHTWGSTNNPGVASNCNTDDDVQDTPNTIGVTGQGCNLNMMSCGFLANVENYMDYSSCGRMFTLGQSERMRAALNNNFGGRNNLWTQQNLIATGTDSIRPPVLCKPTATIIPSNTEICQGDAVNFLGYIDNAPVDTNLKYFWVIPGGAPDTLRTANATVTFAAPGFYGAKLVAYNPAGADTVLVTNVVKVKDNGSRVSLPFSEDFELATFPEVNLLDTVANWQVEGNSRNNVVFQRTTNTSLQGVASVVLRNSLLQANTISTLTSPTINVAGGTPLWLRFSMAFASRGANNTDQLRVLVTTDCGKTWQARLVRTTTSFPSVVTTSRIVGGNNFVPSINEWSNIFVNFNRSANGRPIQIRFEWKSGGGNNFYLDDIVLSNQGPNSVSDELTSQNFKVFPNPLNESSLLQVSENIDTEKLRLRIFNSLGQEMLFSPELMEKGLYSLGNNLNSWAKGVYQLQIILPNEIHRISLVKP